MSRLCPAGRHQPGAAACTTPSHGPPRCCPSRLLVAGSAAQTQFAGLLLGPSRARLSTSARDSHPHSSGGSSSSGEWEAKAPLRAVVNTRSRSPETTSAAAASSSISLDDPSPLQDLLLAAATEVTQVTDPLAAPRHPDASNQPQPSTSQPSALAQQAQHGSAAAVNLAILAAIAAAAAAKFVSVDLDSWGHLPVWQLLQQMPESNWRAYDIAVNSNPMLTKACISGIVYTLGDCLAQRCEGRGLADLDRGRALRSGTCGFIAHGPLSHLYYLNLDALFNDVLKVPPSAAYLPFVKLFIDQTAWSVFWNSTYYALLGLLKREQPAVIVETVTSSWLDLLKAGWKLWPFAHVITYGVIPVQHRLLWVDAVELVWVTFLSLYGQQKREELAAAAGQAPGTAAAMGGQAAKEKEP